MPVTRTRLGCVWKLYSARDTLLGTLTVPVHIHEHLTGENRSVRFVVALERQRMVDLLAPPPSTPSTMRTAVIARHYDHADGCSLHGITPEEIERMDGFAFAPGAGYLRSLVE